MKPLLIEDPRRKDHVPVRVLAKRYGIPYPTIYQRWRKGWEGEDLIMSVAKGRGIGARKAGATRSQDPGYAERQRQRALALESPGAPAVRFAVDPINKDRVTLKELSDRYGVSRDALYRRLRQGQEGFELVRPIDPIRSLNAKKQKSYAEATKHGLKATKMLSMPLTARRPEYA